MPQLMQDNPPQTPGGDIRPLVITPHPPPMDVLSGLISLMQGNGESDKLVSLLNGQDKVQQNQNAYQKGVNKALQEQGYKHGAEALQSGVDPNEIANHSTMKPQQDPAQILTGLLASSLAGQAPQSGQPPQAQPQSTPAQPVQQGMNIRKQNLFEGNDAYGQYLGNLQKVQELNFQTPSQKAELASAGYSTALSKQVMQKVSGQEPLQPADIATIKANVNKLTLDALNASSQRLDNDLKTRQEAIEASQKTINLFGRIGGLFSGSGTTITPLMARLQKEIENIKKVKGRVDSQIANFQPNNPAGSSVNPSADPALIQEARRRGLIK